jgi:hypothetical protein
MVVNGLALAKVATIRIDYFQSKIKFLAKDKRDFTIKFAILPNAYLQQFYSYKYR